MLRFNMLLLLSKLLSKAGYGTACAACKPAT